MSPTNLFKWDARGVLVQLWREYHIPAGHTKAPEEWREVPRDTPVPWKPAPEDTP